MKFENWTIDELLERCTDIDDGSVFMNSDEVSALRRKVAELRSAQPVSQGYKLVPVEPTPKQWAAGLMAIDTGMDKITLVYKAMLAAAPEITPITDKRQTIADEMNMGSRLTKHRFSLDNTTNREFR